MIEAEQGRHEKTIISIEGITAAIWTSHPRTAARLDELVERYPEEYRLTKVHHYGAGKHAGKVDWKSFETRRGLIHFDEPEPEEQTDPHDRLEKKGTGEQMYYMDEMEPLESTLESFEEYEPPEANSPPDEAYAQAYDLTPPWDDTDDYDDDERD